MSNGDALYWILRTALDVTVWGGELIADAELPTRDPAVFVANHAGSLGPIAVAVTLPVRLHPWIIGDMVDGARAGPYLHKDFVKPDLRMPDALGMPFSTALSRITVPLLLRLGCIPVWQDRELLETIRISADALIANKSLLIFPEDPQLSINEGTGMRPFKTGFAHTAARTTIVPALISASILSQCTVDAAAFKWPIPSCTIRTTTRWESAAAWPTCSNRSLRRCWRRVGDACATA